MFAHLRKFGVLTALVACVTAGPVRSDVVTKPGQVIVEDNGELFSAAGIGTAKDEFVKAQSKSGRQVYVETVAELPAAEAAQSEKTAQKDPTDLRKCWL